jgi:hypothetical protein
MSIVGDPTKLVVLAIADDGGSVKLLFKKIIIKFETM